MAGNGAGGAAAGGADGAGETAGEVEVVPVDLLTATVRDVFAAAGCDATEARRVAADLVGANLTGHDSHGVVRVPLYVQWLRAGHVHAGRSARVVTDGGAFVVLDGDAGLGQTVAAEAVAMGVERARAQGSCIVALRNAGHIGRVGGYVETALSAGLISLHFVNVARSALVAPFGAVERRFSTAPVAIGVPLPGRPLVLDFATSLVAEGKVQVASHGGKPLPPDALISADGERSGDPRVLYGDYAETDLRSAANGTGAIRAFGEHKGSGLALVVELLAGAFTGGGCAGPPGGPPGIANGMLSVYLSPEHFGTREEFERIGREYLDWVLSARPADAAEPVLAPGDPEARTRAARTAGGVPLSAGTWAALRRTAAELGVAVAAAG
ncbi:malate/lactate/ureidoglycolate dehydrogenase [Pseudonocardia humida]|uniref:malate/lactate/ureidoglycolate dehydrogenase n=1 Tax=Pseudonocardia humida TaxID=2800819 RepID=UPI00207D1FB2|nr:malate/lactate/ureidoglycolate dehydrogenase [Pseudonocardia humida]